MNSGVRRRPLLARSTSAPLSSSSRAASTWPFEQAPRRRGPSAGDDQRRPPSRSTARSTSAPLSSSSRAASTWPFFARRCTAASDPSSSARRPPRLCPAPAAPRGCINVVRAGDGQRQRRSAFKSLRIDLGTVVFSPRRGVIASMSPLSPQLAAETPRHLKLRRAACAQHTLWADVGFTSSGALDAAAGGDRPPSTRGVAKVIRNLAARRRSAARSPRPPLAASASLLFFFSGPSVAAARTSSPLAVRAAGSTLRSSDRTRS